MGTNWAGQSSKPGCRVSGIIEFNVMKKITVLLAEDHMVVRQGLRSLLSAEPEKSQTGRIEMKSLLFVLALAASLSGIGSASAQIYPSRAITIVAPFPA